MPLNKVVDYKVGKIINKPFISDKPNVRKRETSIKITLIYEDDFTEDRIYGYVTSEEAYEEINKTQELNLNSCYIKDFSSNNYKTKFNKKCEIRNFYANDSFWDCTNKIVLGRINFSNRFDLSNAIFAKGFKDFAYMNFSGGYQSFYHVFFAYGKTIFIGTEFGKGDINFTECNFAGNVVDFNNVKFGDGSISFENSLFGNATISFQSAQFGKGMKQFSNIKFGKVNLSFVYANFGDGDFLFSDISNKEGEVRFNNSTFGKGDKIFKKNIYGSGLKDFSGIDFNDGKVDFSISDFNSGTVNFSSSNYGEGNISFNNSNFGKCDVIFANVNFGEGDTYFTECKFGPGKTNFYNTKFGQGDKFFHNVKFGSGEVLFSKSDFGNGIKDFSMINHKEGKFNISKSNFRNGDVYFSQSVFEDSIFNFSLCNFDTGNIDFSNMVFMNTDVCFSNWVGLTSLGLDEEHIFGLKYIGGTNFGNGNVNFESTCFMNSDVYFQNVKFDGGILDFTNTKFENSINLSGAIINSSKVIFSESKIDNYLIMHNINSSSNFVFNFEKIDKLSLNNCTFSNLVEISNVHNSLCFYKINFLGRIIIDKSSREMIQLLKKQQKPKINFHNQIEKEKLYYQIEFINTSVEEKAEQLTILKENSRVLGKYDDEDFYLYKFRKYYRIVKLHQRIKKSKLNIIWAYLFTCIEFIIADLISSYGTNPFKIIGSIIIVWFSFSIFYSITPIIFVLYSQKCARIPCFLDAMYYSAITFLTIGYGDIAPTGYIKFVSAVEGFLGLFLMAYLTVTFVRKILR